MAELGPQQAQLTVRIDKAVDAELDQLSKDYKVSKEGVCEALLVHAMEVGQVEVAMQKAKDVADQRMRARREKRQSEQSDGTKPSSVVPLGRERKEQRS